MHNNGPDEIGFIKIIKGSYVVEIQFLKKFLSLLFMCRDTESETQGLLNHLLINLMIDYLLLTYL